MTQKSSDLVLKPLIWSVAGPASVLCSLMLLVIKESPFYIDITVVAMTGLLIAWRFKLRGALASVTLLASVIAYDFWIERDPIGLWDIGLASSIALSFVITALASAETLDRMRKASLSALAEVQSWEEKLSELIGAKQAVEGDLVIQRDRLYEIERKAAAAAEEAEKFSRLLSLARSELLTEVNKREEAERKVITLSAQATTDTHSAQLLTIARQEFITESTKREEAERLASTLNIELSKATEQVEDQKQLLKAVQQASEKKIEELLAKLAQAESTLQGLAGQLEELAERLKALQGEKEQLEQSLGDALRPEATVPDEPQGGRYIGLYKQLREQFDDKQTQLLQARNERFLLEQKLLELEKAYEEEDLFDASGIMKEASRKFQMLQSQILAQQEEIDLLEKIIENRD